MTQVEAVIDRRLEPIEIRDRLLQPAKCLAQPRVDRLEVLDIDPSNTAIFNGGGLVLSRPDQHVAWRGDQLPAGPLALIDRVRAAAK